MTESPSTNLHPHDDTGIKDPPRTIIGILRQLGPGLIIAGSIVGSGELIATTAVGAEAGFTLMWLVIIGCVIKVFTQVEFARYTICNGRTTMDGLNEVPGPRFRVNWIVWYWLIMFSMSLAQLGGIVGGVGQALTISKPLTAAGKLFNEYQDVQIKLVVNERLLERATTEGDAPQVSEMDTERLSLLSDLDRIEAPYRASDEYLQVSAELDSTRQDLAGSASSSPEAVQLRQRESELSAREQELRGPPRSHDEVIWAAIITFITMGVLVVGRYNLIQTFSTALVAGFTFITIGNLVHLQRLPEWRVSWDDLLSGLSFQLPAGDGLATALMAFGIIGVGATELIQYPYWCKEKGYAKWTGPRDDSPEWSARANGWLTVLRWDAWASMLVYTFATVAFYLLGAAVLGRTGLNPEGSQMIRTLAEMYVPVFGSSAQLIFLFGAFAVLYSTFFVANASHARVTADAVRVFGLSKGGEKAERFWTVLFCALFPLLCLTVYCFIRAPKQLVLTSGLMQAIMLPMLGGAALYFRYQRCDARVRPGTLWDICLWISGAGLLVAGGWAFFDKIRSLFGG